MTKKQKYPVERRTEYRRATSRVANRGAAGKHGKDVAPDPEIKRNGKDVGLLDSDLLVELLFAQLESLGLKFTINGFLVPQTGGEGYLVKKEDAGGGYRLPIDDDDKNAVNHDPPLEGVTRNTIIAWKSSEPSRQVPTLPDIAACFRTLGCRLMPVPVDQKIYTQVLDVWASKLPAYHYKDERHIPDPNRPPNPYTDGRALNKKERQNRENANPKSEQAGAEWEGVKLTPDAHELLSAHRLASDAGLLRKRPLSSVGKAVELSLEELPQDERRLAIEEIRQIINAFEDE